MTTVRRTVATRIGVGTAVALALGSLFLFDTLRKQAGAEAANADAEVAAIPVVVQRIAAQPLNRTLEAVGTVVADQQVLVAAEAAGRITRLHIDSGATVAAGAPLLQINDASQRQALARHRVAARLAEDNLARATRLHGHSVSRAEYEQQVAAAAESRALVAQSEADLALHLVRAPFSGALGIRRVSVGQYVQAGTPLVTLTDLDTRHVDFTVPERYRPLLTPGLAVSLVREGGMQASTRGHITAIDAQVDVTHRAVAVRATLDAEGLAHWWPGAFAHVRVHLPEGAPVLHVPAIAVSASLSGQSVFVVREEGARDVARQVTMTVGEPHGDHVAVAGGALQAGDLVVVAGQVNLQDKAPVAWRMHTPSDVGPAPSVATARGQ